MKKLFALLAVLIYLTATAQKNEYKIVRTYPIKSGGGWDYIVLHDGKIYVSHATQVNILNEETGDSVGVIPYTPGVHGIAFDNDLKRGYTSNGRSNNVTVFDAVSNVPLAKITTGENPDAILFEPYTKTIITCNGRSQDLSIIDPQTNKVIHAISVGGKPETAVSDASGNLFVNLEDKNQIVKVDLKKFSVTNRWSLSPAEGPTGLAYDPISKRLFAGCEKVLVILNASNGKVVRQLPIGAGCDGVVFDATQKRIFTSNGEGTISVIKENSADDYTLLGNYPTKKGARTITMDEKKGRLFLPTADFDTRQQHNGRPPMVPGTFQVLVIE
jgi:YVTN family beta-propeller protein